MDKREAAAWYANFVRIVQLGENLMLRQMPSEVSKERAKVCYEAAREFYLAVDRDAHEVEQLLGARPDQAQEGGDV